MLILAGSDVRWAHLSLNGADILQLIPDLPVLDLSVLNLYQPGASNTGVSHSLCKCQIKIAHTSV